MYIHIAQGKKVKIIYPLLQIRHEIYKYICSGNLLNCNGKIAYIDIINNYKNNLFLVEKVIIHKIYSFVLFFCREV